jgi:hypothetical protein
MATNYNARIATRGLILSVDAANPASLPTNIRRNLIAQSENLSNAVWSKSAIDASFTNMAAPDGSLTVYSITEQANSAQHLLYYSIGTVVINDTFTWSGHFKNNTNTTQIVLHTNGEGTVTFNISGATAGTVAGSSGANTLSSSIVSLGNGWYRCAAVFRKANTVGVFYVSNQNGLGVYVGNTGISYYAWGLQLEYSTSVSTYYPISAPDSTLNTRWNDVTGTSRSVPASQDLLSVEVLVVAGGGAGGNGTGFGYESGGGGAGGLIYNAAFSVIPGTSYTATVGEGGGAIASTEKSLNGGNSSFSTLVAIGGGGGATAPATGSSGGSGGGGAHNVTAGGTAIFGQGFPGATPVQGSSGGGGGGAGGPGKSTAGNADGSGGPGLPFTISGSLQYYAGGGGGSRHSNVSGGIGGGGAGVDLVGYASGGPGLPNTGGGGGGANQPGINIGGGAGGSGIVIVRYPTPQRATGGRVSIVNNFVIHTFTSGTSSFTVIPASFNFSSSGSFVNVTTPILYDSRNSGSLVFNNLDNYVAMPELPSQTNSPLSVFAWVFLNATPVGTNGIWGHYGVNNNNIHYEINPTATRLRLGDTNKADLPMLAVGSWQFVGFTSTGSSHSYYVNGVLSTTWAGSTGTILGGNGTFPSSHMIGRSDATRTWNGRIAQVAIYNAELTATEVLNNFNALRGRYAV